MWSVVDGMVDVVPELRTGMVSIGIVMRNQSDASDMMALAILAGELREQAGLLGSTFTPALSRRRALNDADQLKIERVLGRIEELQTLIDARISSIPELRGTIAYMDMKHLYMGDGIAYIERLRELASRGPAGAGLTTREVADAYVPLMRSITQFRDFMLDRVEQRIAAQRASSVRVLLATLAAAAMLAAALLLSLSQFRKRVIRPFVQATRIIGAIADGGPVPAIPLDRYRGEINGMFSALSVLKDTAASKSRLESERDRLILDLATMAETDFLTGLLNRRAFERRFEETRALARRRPGAGLHPVRHRSFQVHQRHLRSCRWRRGAQGRRRAVRPQLPQRRCGGAGRWRGVRGPVPHQPTGAGAGNGRADAAGHCPG